MGAIRAHICSDALASHSKYCSDLWQHNNRSDDSGSIRASGTSDLRTSICGGLCRLAQANSSDILLERLLGRFTITSLGRLTFLIYLYVTICWSTCKSTLLK